jgi:hypothetical protein
MPEAAEQLVCWKCGAPLGDMPLPLSRFAECRACHTRLHVCRMCEFYDTRVAKSCREPIAEEVKDKTRANFCDYFRARPGAYIPPDRDARDRARAELDALFGAGSSSDSTAPATADEARRRLDALFGGDTKD